MKERSNPVRVLIVDDEPAVRKSLAIFLEDAGYAVSMAARGEEAMDLLEQGPPDVAIVDPRLPGMSGETFILRAHARYPELRFLIFTGAVDFDLSDELIAAGVHPEHALLKPLYRLGSMAAAIEDLLQESEQTQ